MSIGQTYNNFSSWRLARYQAYVVTFESRLTLVQAQMTELISDPNESYNFNSGDGGSQAATKRKLDDLNKQEEWLINMISKYTRMIYGGNNVNHVLRRK